MPHSLFFHIFASCTWKSLQYKDTLLFFILKKENDFFLLVGFAASVVEKKKTAIFFSFVIVVFAWLYSRIFQPFLLHIVLENIMVFAIYICILFLVFSKIDKNTVFTVSVHDQNTVSLPKLLNEAKIGKIFHCVMRGISKQNTKIWSYEKCVSWLHKQFVLKRFSYGNVLLWHSGFH